MLQARLYALYQGSRTIFSILVFGYVCEIAAMSAIAGFLDAHSRSKSISLVIYVIQVHGFTCMET